MTEKSKTALLLGSSYSAIPILRSLQNRGVKVIVCGYEKSDPCHHLADGSILVDYSDIEQVANVYNQLCPDYLIPSCNDNSYRTASVISDSHGVLPGFDNHKTTCTLHSKELLREFLALNCLPCPQTYTVDDALSIISEHHPLIIKPVDSTSGKGIATANSRSSLLQSIEYTKSFSTSGQYLIEDFVYGRLISHSAFIHDRSIRSEFFVDEYCTTYEFQVNCSCHPSSVTDETKQNIGTTITTLARKLNLADGLLHTQFIINEHNVYLIECMRRAPGDLYGHLIELSTGLNYWDMYTSAFLSMPLPPSIPSITKLIARHTVTSPTELSSISLEINSNSDRFEIFQLSKSGDFLKAAPYDKISIVFIYYKSYDQLIADTPVLSNKVTINSLP